MNKKIINLERVIIVILIAFIFLQEKIHDSVSVVNNLKINPSMVSSDFFNFLTSLEIAKKNSEIISFNNLEINFLDHESKNSGVIVECENNSLTKKDLKILVPYKLWENTVEQNRSSQIISIMLKCLSNKKIENNNSKKKIIEASFI